MEIREKGYSLIELLVGITILALFACLILPNFVRARDEAREEEVKANLHIIQQVLERFAADNNGTYPEYLLGGDLQGRISDTESFIPGYSHYGSSPPEDQILAGGYLPVYPKNPFLRPGDGIRSTIFMTGGRQTGEGDIRFGYSGELMGNCLDDPRVLFEGQGMPTGYANTMRGSMMSYLGVLNINSPNSFFCMGGIPNWVTQGGGASDPEGGTLRAWWPGQFFYRAGGIFETRSFPHNPDELPVEYIWRWPYQYIDKYMLGAYGSLRTEGIDVIRLTTVEGHACSTMGGMQGYISNQFYQDHSNLYTERCHPDFDVKVYYSNPEVFGGGDKGLMPQFPYYDWGIRDWLYGAPDGHNDGIILVLMPV